MQKFFNRGIGAYFLVDGQFGSTGKGLLASYLARHEGYLIDLFCSNAGPNSGHTHYFGNRKTVLKQLPSAAVYRKQGGFNVNVVLTAGAIIDPKILITECEEYGIRPIVSPRAACISDADRTAEGSGSIAAVAGTRQGVGAALVRKVQRDPMAVMIGLMVCDPKYPGGFEFTMGDYFKWNEIISFHEVSQGFSLGLNSRFYPKVTSRECTVMQAMTDARIHPLFVRKTAMVVRTFPIRVGDVDGHSSGDWYPDQKELTWADIGVEPETTTVTGRIRRVATWSDMQFIDALRANQPDLILVNFMNYLTQQAADDFHRHVTALAIRELRKPVDFLWGYGPRVEHISETVR